LHFLPPLFASSFSQNSENGKLELDSSKKYEIGIYLLNVGKIDLQTGTYDLDFYLWIRSLDDNFVESVPKIEFMNGKATLEPVSV
jgi:hypothetical protein